MSKIEIEVSDDLNFIKMVPSVNWTVLVSKILKERLNEIEEIKRIVSKSKLTEEDVEEISSKINMAAAENYK